MSKAPRPHLPKLRQHLTWTIALKLVFLFALWWLFVREERVAVNADTAASHLLQAAAQQPAPTPQPQEQP